MEFNALIPELTVSDIDRTRAFYEDVLQFHVEYERPADKFIYMSYEGIQLMFEQDNGNWSTGELQYPYGRGINFEMTISDVEAMYRRITNAGVKPFRELMTNTYRSGDTDIVQKEFLVQDPDGYLLRFTD